MHTGHKKTHPISHITRALVNGGLIASCLAFSSGAWATGLTIVHAWEGGWTTSQKTAMDNAASAFSTLFGSHFSNSGTITLAATAYDDDDDYTLASAGSAVVYVGEGTFGGGEVIRTKLQGGADLNGDSADGIVRVNFAYFTELDLNDPVPETTYDFYSTLYHEYVHALGFASSLTFDGDPYFGNQSDGSGEWATFDRFLVNASGNRVVDNDFKLVSDVWIAARAGGSSMFFNGAHAMAANGGNPVNLYSPTLWSDGSSISHVDDETLSFSKMMMAAATLPGLSARTFSLIEIGMMQDLGYTVTVVPEPATYAMMLAGLGLVGWSVRRRKA